MADKPPVYVLDTFALLAYLQDEPAASRIEELLKAAEKTKCRLVLSLINLGEILYLVERRCGISKVHNSLRFIRHLPIEILPADERLVFAAAHVKANYPISYADAFAIAAAQSVKGTVITGDPEFGAVEEIVPIEWLKP